MVDPVRIVFRGGKYDGRSREFASQPADLFEIPMGQDRVARYVRTPDVVDGALVYAHVDQAGIGVSSANGKAVHTSLPYVVHFSGGPYDRQGRYFAARPAPALIIPIAAEPGWFAKYEVAEEQAPGRPLLYTFTKKFEGER